MGWRDVQEGGDISICIADSLRRAAETSTALQSNYTPIKIFFKKAFDFQ